MPAKPHGRLVLIAVVDRGTVVGGENQQRIVGDAEAVQRAHHLADRPVELQDHVAAGPKAALARKAGMRNTRHMHVVGSHIEEKRLVLVPGDELRGLQGDRVGHAFVDPSAERPPVIHPMREMPLTIVLSWPWLGRSFSSSGFSDPVGQSPTLWS